MADTAERLFEIQRTPGVRRQMPELHEGIGRVVLLYSEAREEEKQAGFAWYQDAHDFAANLAEEADLKIEHVAGVIAELSPMMNWDENMRRAADLIRKHEAKGLGRSFANAKAILEGKDPFEVVNDPGRANFKIQAFFDNIIHPSESNRVTIDRHMWGALFGEYGVASSGFPHASEAQYRGAEKMFQDAARALDLLPLELQSICWVTWRRKFGVQAICTTVQPEFTFD